jgi:hypothetical protein
LDVYSSLDEILPGLERYGALKKEFEEYHEKLEREQVGRWSLKWEVVTDV